MTLPLLSYIVTIIVCLITMKRMRSDIYLSLRKGSLSLFTRLCLLFAVLLLINILLIKSGLKTVDYIPINKSFILLVFSLTLFFSLKKKKEN